MDVDHCWLDIRGCTEVAFAQCGYEWLCIRCDGCNQYGILGLFAIREQSISTPRAERA